MDKIIATSGVREVKEAFACLKDEGIVKSVPESPSVGTPFLNLKGAQLTTGAVLLTETGTQVRDVQTQPVPIGKIHAAADCIETAPVVKSRGK